MPAQPRTTSSSSSAPVRLTGPNGGSYGGAPHRHAELQQLLRTATALPGPKMNLPLTRLPVTEVEGARTPLDRNARAEIARLRALVAACLKALARRIDEHLVPAIETARRAWESADSLVIVDHVLAASFSETRRALHRAANTAGPAVRAVAIEGILAVDAASGLAGLAERRLSSLIRLRLQGPESDLLPQGRPFIDLGRAIAEAAREWS